jgi:maleate isomerase
LTPYSAEISALLVDYFQRNSLEIVSFMYMDMSDDRDVAMVSPNNIITAAKEAIVDEADALFISCTAMRSTEVISVIEKEIGKPVFTSNQATFDEISFILEKE